MDQLIPVINKLQDVFNAVGGVSMDLPQIVVVGSQSSGKSSVLENIVGRDFLPRGSGIVTRRPLILQLVYTPAAPNAPPEQQEWGEFLHKPKEKFYDFNQIRREIELETDRVTGKNAGLSPQPIRLRISSPYVLNLTLVDLPGMTRNPVGDQPKDIEHQIRSMILTYISKPNAIILSVTAANTDLANSDGIQLAREVDPQGMRTLGVITKIDIMDRGTDAVDVLSGRIVPLQLGYVGVINRSQQDINSGKSIRDALKSEHEYFVNNPLYRNMASRLGTPYLTKVLNRVLMNHIRDALPDLKMRIQKMINEARNELASYGDTYFDSKQSQGAMLLQILTRFSNEYKSCISGKIREKSVTELTGGARIHFIFQEIYVKCLKSITLGDGGISLSDIRTAIMNASGPRGTLFIPDQAFELLVRKLVQRLEDPSLQCVELVYDELQRIITQLECHELQRFPVLRERVVDTTNNLLINCKNPTRKMINNLIAIEHAYINSNHRDFICGGGAIEKIFEQMTRNQQQDEAQRIQQQQEALRRQQGPPEAQGQLPPQQAQTGPGQHRGQGQSQPNIQGRPPQQMQPQQPQQQPGGESGGFFNRFFGSQAQPQAANQQQQQTPQQQQSQQAQQQPVRNPPVPNRQSQNMQGMQQGMQQQQQQQQQQQHQHQQQHMHQQQPSQQQPSQQQPSQQQQQQQQQRLFSGGGALAERLDQVPMTIKASPPGNDREKFETELIYQMMESYFNIVRKNVADSVPKTVMHFLVNTSIANIQNELVRVLYKEELFEELLEENPAIAQRRKACLALLDVLQKANDVLLEVREFNPGSVF